MLSTLQDGVSALRVASQNGHLEVARMLIENSANVNCQGNVSINVHDIGSITLQHMYLPKMYPQPHCLTFVVHHSEVDK